MTSKFITCENIPKQLKVMVQEIQQRLDGVKYCFIGSIAMSIYSCLCDKSELPIAPKEELNNIYSAIYTGTMKLEQRYEVANYHRNMGDNDILIDFKDFSTVTARLRSIGYVFGKPGSPESPPILKGIEFKNSITMSREGVALDLVNQKTLFKNIFGTPDTIFNFEFPLLKPEYLQKNKVKAFKDRLDLKDLYDIWFYDHIKDCLKAY
jgi:hypothetical protein